MAPTSPHERPHDERSQTGETSLLTVLCLYLVLLAFFILLHSMAVPDASRARDVWTSVQRTFVGSETAPARPAELSEGVDLEAAASLLVRSLTGRLAELAPELASESRAGAPMVQLTLADEQVFAAGSIDLLSGGDALVAGVAEALTSQTFGESTFERLAIETEVLMARSEGAVARSGALVRQLIARGLEAESVSAAILPGIGGKVIVRFRIEPASAQGGSP